MSTATKTRREHLRTASITTLTLAHFVDQIKLSILCRPAVNLHISRQDREPMLVALPSVPETLESQVEVQVARLESKEDNSVDILQARRAQDRVFKLTSESRV